MVQRWNLINFIIFYFLYEYQFTHADKISLYISNNIYIGSFLLTGLIQTPFQTISSSGKYKSHRRQF